MNIIYFFNFFLAKAVPAGISLASLVLIPYYMDVEEYGKYVIFLTTASIANAVLFYWVRVSYVKKAAIVEHESYSIARKIQIFLYVVIVLPCAVYAFISLELITALVMYFAIVTQSLFELKAERYKALLQSSKYTYCYIGRSAIFFISIVCLGEMGLISSSYILLSVFYCISFIVPVYVFKSKVDIVRPKKENLLSFIRYGFPLSVSYLLESIQGNLDKYLVGLLLGNSAVAAYNLIYSIFKQGVGVFGLVIYNSLFPLLVKGGRRVNTTQYFFVSSIIPLLMVLIISFLLDRVLGRFLSQEYMVVYEEHNMLFMIFAVIYSVKTYAIDPLLQYYNNTLAIAKSTGVGALMFCFIAYFFIAEFAIYGAILSAIVTYSCALLVAIFFLYKKKGE